MAKITMIDKCTWTGRAITTLKEGIALCCLSAMTVGIGYVPCGDLEATPVKLLQKHCVVYDVFKIGWNMHPPGKGSVSLHLS